MSEKNWRVLFVDDDSTVREPLAFWLKTEHGFKIDTAVSRQNALQQIQEKNGAYDVLLIDDMLIDDENDPDGFPMPIGVELMQEVRAQYPDVAAIIFTGWSGTERGLTALRAGAYRYLSKPIVHEELAITIQMAAEQIQLKEEFERANKERNLLQTFMKIGRATTSLHSLDQVLAEVHKQVGHLMDTREMDIVLYDKNSQTLSFELCYDRGKKHEKWERPFGNGFTEWVIENNQPLLIKHFNQEQEYLRIEANIVFLDSSKDITQSYLGVPLIFKDEVIGAINVQAYAPNRFNEDHQQILTAIASQVAGAIQNAKLISELFDEREGRQALLQSSLDAIVAIDNEKGITVFNKQAEAFFGWSEKEMIGKRTDILFADGKVGRKIFKELASGNNINGRHISFKHKDGRILPGLFSATVIYDKAGNPIGQAGFIRDLHELRLLEARQQAWSEVSEAVTMSKELDKILESIMQSVSHIIPTATGGEFHLFKHNKLRLAANTFNFSQDAIQAFSLAIGEGVAGQVFKTGKHKIVNDSRKDKHFKTFQHGEAPRYRSMICVPLKVQRQRLGTLTLTSDEVGKFKRKDVELLRPFAGQAAISIKNTQLLDEANEGLDFLKSISKASSILISEQEPRRVLHAIVKEAKKATKAWRVSAILIGKTGRAKELDAIGYEGALNIDTVLRQREGISVRVMQSMEPCFVEDTKVCQENLNPDMERDGVRAAACLPLKLGQKAIGVMWIQFHQPRIFTNTEQEALQIYTEQAALAYNKTRQMQELEHMRQAADALAGAADLTDVLTQIVSSARKVLNADWAAIWSYDNIQEKFLLPYCVANGIDPVIWQRFTKEEPGVGQTAYTVMKQGAITVEDAGSRKQYPFLGKSTRRLLKEVNTGSFQGISLNVGKEQLGVLYLNYNQPRRFSREERSTAATFAHHAALALKKARLLEQLNKTQNAARIVAQVTALENLNDTLNQIANGMIEAMGCDAVVLYEYNQKQVDLSYPPVVAGVRNPIKTRRWPKVPLDNFVYQLLHKETSYIVENVKKDKLFKEKRFAVEEEIASCIAVPLRLNAVKVGIMFVNYRKTHRFTDDELKNIDLFANQAAVAIRNAQHFEDLREIKGLIGNKTAVEWIQMVSAAWGHTIRREVSITNGRLSLLKAAVEQQDKALFNKEFAQLKKGLTRISETPITAPLTYEDETILIQPNELLRTHFTRQWQHARYSGVELVFELAPDLEKDILIWASSGWLRQAFELVTDNAIWEFEKEKTTTPKLIISTQYHDSKVLIGLTNNGPTISNRALEHFSKGIPFPKQDEDRGSGVGLQLAQTIVNTYSGSLDISQLKPEGTVVTFTLPAHANSE